MIVILSFRNNQIITLLIDWNKNVKLSNILDWNKLCLAFRKTFSVFVKFLVLPLNEFLDRSENQMQSTFQKRPPEVFREKQCSLKFHKIHRKILVSSIFSNKAAGLRLQHRCFPENFAKLMRTLPDECF